MPIEWIYVHEWWRTQMLWWSTAWSSELRTMRWNYAQKASRNEVQYSRKLWFWSGLSSYCRLVINSNFVRYMWLINIYFLIAVLKYVFLLVLFSAQSYDVRLNSWCSPYRESFETLSEAKTQCTNDRFCAMIYDDGGSHNHFLLCDEGANIKTSAAGSLLHIKRSEYMCIWVAFSNITNNKCKSA